MSKMHYFSNKLLKLANIGNLRFWYW